MATSGIRHRIFIAVELESQLRSRIVDLEQDLQRAGARFRWISAENLHFTVRFLGEITPAQLAQVKLATRDVAAATAPFRLSLHGIGAFPSVQRPQAAGGGGRGGDEGLATLASRLGA